MDKNRYDWIKNLLFIVMVGLTFFNLYENIIWLSCILTAMLFVFIAFHIRDYKKEIPKRKKVFVLTLLVSINFLLANAVIVIAEYVYPY